MPSSPPDDVIPLDPQASLGEALIEAEKLTRPALDRAQRLQNETADRLSRVLLRLGLVSEGDLAAVLAKQAGAPLIPAGEFPVSPVLGGRLSTDFLKQAGILPVADQPGGLVVALADPLDGDAIAGLRYAVDRPIICRTALPSDIEKAFAQLYGDGSGARDQIVARFGMPEAGTQAEDTERLKDLASEAPVIRLVNLWIDNAAEIGASDIHIEPTEHTLRIRLRVDGRLRKVDDLPPHFGPAVSSRVKIMARLDIAERRLPQDGKFRLAVRGRDIDFRVSVIPTVHGEAVVLRVLDRDHVSLDFDRLGYDELSLARFRTALHRPHGILLVTGPTGSGKTTSLYTSLLELRRPEVKILTVEDPVEYQIDGINQTQVQPQIGLDFAAALRAFLRHNPDIILVGEIRDLETARIAVQSALTGHLVLSTLHTNDAASAVTRLLDMGVDDYLIASTVNGISAQRLLRKLCPHCRAAYAASPELAAKLDRSDATLYRPVGCPHCEGTGFSGRTAIVETLIVTEELRRSIMRRAPAAEIREAAMAEGMETMQQNGVRKCLAGVTTFDEVLRATGAC